jgi:hypothetical protein
VAKARVVVDDSESETDRIQAAEELAQLNEDEGGDLFRVTDAIRATAGVKLLIVRTFPTTPGIAGEVGTMSLAEFSHDEMRSRYGAGIYRVRLQGPKGFLPGGGRVEIAAVSTDKPRNGNGEIAALLDAMNRQQTENRERNNRLLELAIPGALGIIAAMVGKNNSSDLPAILAALRPPEPLKITDLTTALASVQQLTKPAEIKDPIETILSIMDRVKNLTGDGEKQGESNWLDVVRDLVKEAVPAVRPMLDNLAEQQRQRAAQPPLVIPPNTRQPSVSAPIPPSPAVSSAESTFVPAASGAGESDMMKNLIQTHLAKVKEWAKDDKNPATYAEVFRDELPQIVASYLTPADARAYLNRADWWERVIEFYPALGPYQEWCEEFREELIQLVQEQIDEEKERTPPQITDPVNGESVE